MLLLWYQIAFMPEKRKCKSWVNAVLLAVLVKGLSSSANLLISVVAKQLVYHVRVYGWRSGDGTAAIIIIVGGVVAVGVVVVRDWLLTA